jgi:hypothetical protein
MCLVFHKESNKPFFVLSTRDMAGIPHTRVFAEVAHVKVLYIYRYKVSLQKKTQFNVSISLLKPMKLSIVRNGYNCYYYSNVRKRYVNKFFMDRIAMFDFAVAQPELYIEFFDVDIREYATEHKHPILTMKSLEFA